MKKKGTSFEECKTKHEVIQRLIKLTSKFPLFDPGVRPYYEQAEARLYAIEREAGVAKA